MIDDDSKPEKHVHDEFWRVNDVYGFHVSWVIARSGDGKQKESSVEYWDYSRLADVEGVETTVLAMMRLAGTGCWPMV